jgi:hypothetical protein
MVILAACVAHLYTTTAHHGERLIAIETVQNFFMHSTEQNRRDVVTPNPLTAAEEAILDFITSAGGDQASLDDLEVARKALFREGMDKDKPAGDREKYLNLLPVLDARWALKKLHQRRRELPLWRRLLESLT